MHVHQILVPCVVLLYLCEEKERVKVRCTRIETRHRHELCLCKAEKTNRSSIQSSYITEVGVLERNIAFM